MKHNPAFLTKDELVESFVVRLTDLDFALEHVREQPEGPPQHMLLIGPRGIGKTTMVLRIAAAVQADPELGKQWYPIVFGEEAYEVGTAAELWLEAILHLARQTGDARLTAAYQELKKQRDEKRLYEQALARLMDFADAEKKRLLVVVENMNMLLGEQLSEGDGWTLRHTLQNERRILLLGTATTRFDEIDNVDKAMYDLFWTHDLRPLETEECRMLWQSVSGQEISSRRIRPIEILTGGSPRLLGILASFAADVSFRELMLKLTELVDDNTTYFKSNLESLPTAERKAYVALSDIWSPATAREVAEAARLDVNKTSALLHRMVQRGAVSEVKRRGGKVSYQVAERMYNIYHLMRRHGGDESRVRAVVQFMVHMYDTGGLVEAVRPIVHEARSVDPEARGDHLRLISSMLRRTAPPEVTDVVRRRGEPLIAQVREERRPSGYLAAHLAGESRRDEAEQTTREAVRASTTVGQKAACHHALVHIPLMSDKLNDALAGAGKAASQETAADELVRNISEIYVEVAAAGHAAEALAHLTALPTRQKFEPLIVALQMIVGEEHNAPQEVVEVAKDIVQQVEALKQAAPQNKSRPAKIRKSHPKPKRGGPRKRSP
jgi:hypothetical protein